MQAYTCLTSLFMIQTRLSMYYMYTPYRNAVQALNKAQCFYQCISLWGVVKVTLTNVTFISLIILLCARGEAKNTIFVLDTVTYVASAWAINCMRCIPEHNKEANVHSEKPMELMVLQGLEQVYTFLYQSCFLCCGDHVNHNTVHEIHETCPSVTFQFIEKKKTSIF